MLENAKFIWQKELDLPNSYAEFFDTFSSNSGRVCLRISVDGDYTAYVNGKYAGSSQYGDFEHYKIYDEIDISSLVKKGENTLAILVWHPGEDSQRYKKYKAGLCFEVCENETVILSSSENTLSRKSPTYKSGENKKISPQLGFSFSYDATKEDIFPCSMPNGMTPSICVDKSCNFYKRPIKKHTLKDTVCAKRIESENTYLFDLGKEYVGYLTLGLDAECEGEINIAYGEYLFGGHVKRKIHNRDFSVDYRARAGKGTFTNYMLRLACRYIEISTQIPINDGANSHSKNLSISALDCLAFSLINNTP